MNSVLDKRGVLRTLHEEEEDSDDSFVIEQGIPRIPARGSVRLKGPLRLLRLLVACVVGPAILVGWPLYMRYHVLREDAIPLALSDMRILDHRVSTTWCQQQTVRVNTTFSAFVVDSRPGRISPGRQHVSMVRDLTLSDDMKEYWGFYLLQGSSVTVSTCARWPGASLIVIRGHKHLQECAYIGDDSSEEAEEVRRFALRRQLEERRRSRQQGQTEQPATSPTGQTEPPTTGQPGVGATKTPSNQPKRMRKVKGDSVVFHEKHRPPSRLYYLLDDSAEDIIVDQSAKNALHIFDHDKASGRWGDFPLEDGKVGQRTESDEVVDSVVQTLRALGDKGQRALDKLVKAAVRAPPLPRDPRVRREALAALNAHDEAGNAAAEELPPALPTDGLADIRGSVNETTSLDESRSELWSSFSSSEEALLGCAGLVLNLPLSPHRACQAHRPKHELGVAAAANKITYRIPVDGYYFFVLNSENEVQQNFVRVNFDLDKAVFDVSEPIAQCTNTTAPCALPLRFLSDDTLVLEVPVGNNETLWNDHYVAISTCEPRTSLYMAFVVAVPLLILLCAFH